MTNQTIEGGKLRVKYSQRGRLELSVRRKQLQFVEQAKKKLFRGAALVEQIFWEVRNGVEPDSLLMQLNGTLGEVKRDFAEIGKTEKSIRKGSRKLKVEQPHYGRFNFKHRREWHFNVEQAICWLPDFSSIFIRLRSAYDICKIFFKAYAAKHEPEHATASFNKLSAVTAKIENATAKIEKLMGIDFGSDKEFLMLFRQWYFFEYEGYNIEFYPFDNCTRTRGSGQSFLVGSFNRSEPFRWYFNKGGHCGVRLPETGMEVRLHCRMRDEILAFRETSTCQFRMDFGTPAACVDEYKRRVDAMDDVTLDEWANEAGLFK
jgi:hypothetical protein